MKEIVVLSGKGGTGKTSITASFAALAKNSLFADCDVDAADLHLLLQPKMISSNQFYSGNEAIINQKQCISCGTCKKLCRFGAVTYNNEDNTYSIEPTMCEGCGVCVHFCNSNAVTFPERKCGEWYVSTTNYGPMVHARLDIGAENSGKLVSLVRQQARHKAHKEKVELVIIDGPPGIGCPVIASVTGTDYVFSITEPTLSGIHDLQRLIELINHFKIPFFVCVNRWDINPDNTKKIKEITKEAGGIFIGTISYDTTITKAQHERKSIVEYGESTAANEIKNIWRELCQTINA